MTARRLAALAAAVMALLACPAPASGSWTMTSFSDQGDEVALGQPMTRSSTSATLRTHVDGPFLTVMALDEPEASGPRFALNLGTGGAAWAPGVFDNVGTPPSPSLLAGGSNGRTCREPTGRFEVRDVEVGDGEVRRLWAVFEQHCLGTPAATWGEVRIGAPNAPLSALPSIVRWPSVGMHAERSTLPLQIRASVAMRLSAPRVVGGHASSFALGQDGCAGRALEAGEACTVDVLFRPLGMGAREAVLEVPADAGVLRVPLQGHAQEDRPQLAFRGEADEWVSQGRAWAFERPGSDVWAVGDRYGIRFGAEQGDTWFSGEVVPGTGELLSPGEYGPGARAGAVSFGGDGRGCGWETGHFTIERLDLGPDDVLRAVDLRFEQRCRGDGPLLTGTLRWRAEDAPPAPLAPWMLESGVLRGPLTPLGPDRHGWTAAPAAPAPATMPTAPPMVRGATLAPPAAPASACAGRPWPHASLLGTGKADRLVATASRTLLSGGSGRDLLLGGQRGDCLVGGAGDDRIEGGRGNDVLLGGSGRDRLRGGPGRDRLDCGPGGRDVAIADLADTVRRCERVVRRPA